MATWAEVTTAQTLDEIRADETAACEAQGVNVQGFDDPAPIRAEIELNARAIKKEQDNRVLIAKGGFLETSAEAGSSFVDQALTWYDEERIAATYARWNMVISCASTAGPYTIAANSGELIAEADDGTLFKSANTTPRTVTSGGFTTCVFECLTPGTVGNQTPGNVTNLMQGLPGLDVTNALPFALLLTTARDAESDAAAIARAPTKWGTLGAGWTDTSIRYLVTVYSPTVTRVLVRSDNPNGPGTIEVVQANASGPSTGGENATTLAGLTAPEVMSLGTGGLTVVSASLVTVNIVGTVYGDGTNPDLLADAKAALDQLAANFPLADGVDIDTLYKALIADVILGGNVPEYDVDAFGGAVNVVLTTPAGDTALAVGDVIVFSYAGLVLG